MSFTESLRGLFELRSLRWVDTTGVFHGEAFIVGNGNRAMYMPRGSNVTAALNHRSPTAFPLTFQTSVRSIAAHETIPDRLDFGYSSSGQQNGRADEKLKPASVGCRSGLVPPRDWRRLTTMPSPRVAIVCSRWIPRAIVNAPSVASSLQPLNSQFVTFL